MDAVLLFLPETTLLLGALGALLLSILDRAPGRVWAWGVVSASAGLAAGLATIVPPGPGIRVNFRAGTPSTRRKAVKLVSWPPHSA